jgi:hypothetical protein
VAHPETRSLRAGSDAAEARWVPLAEVPRYDTTDGLLDMIQRAAAVSRGGRA